MRLGTRLLTLTVLALAACAPALAQEQQKEQQVIDDFTATRGVSFDGPGKAAKKQSSSPSRRSNTAKGKNTAAGATPGGTASVKKQGGKRPGPGKSNEGGSEAAAMGDGEGVGAGGGVAAALPAGRRALALGYTILLRDDSGSLFEVDASREFKTGEHLAVALETNADGYLYLFGAENGRNPELLFPNAQIDGGANAVQAHARETFPTAAGADEQYLLEVTDPPAAEHLFVVFSRRPLPDVPAGDALVRYCAKNLADCAWKPTAAQWSRILGGAEGRGVTEAKNTRPARGSAQPVAAAALQRGLKVRKEDPKPAVVRVNNSRDADTLVTEIVLTHK